MQENDTYQLRDILDFVAGQQDLERSTALTDQLLSKDISQVDLLFRFANTQTPALGFRHVKEDEYALVYLAPTIAAVWEEEWEIAPGTPQPRSASFIDIANLDSVNASVDAMRASLFGPTSETPNKHAAVSLLYRVAHAGHEVSSYEATQLYDLAKALEGFLSALAPLGRKR